jgi:hypothetical protein
MQLRKIEHLTRQKLLKRNRPQRHSHHPRNRTWNQQLRTSSRPPLTATRSSSGLMY